MRAVIWMSFVVAASPLALLACSPSARADIDASPGTRDGTGPGVDGSPNGDNCSDASKLIYVFDEDNKLSKFDPNARTFSYLGNTGDINCDDSTTPFSMGVDRNAVAWVEFMDSKVFKIDLTDPTLKCSAKVLDSPGGLTTFGMGFSTDTAGGTVDTLYLAGVKNGEKLGAVNPTTLAITAIGPLSAAPELTGTGAGELWGWFPDFDKPHIVNINKTTGATIKSYEEDSLAGTPDAFAFAYGAGNFWVFNEFQHENWSTAWAFDQTTGVAKGTVDADGRKIVGAGVSTCAPVVIN